MHRPEPGCLAYYARYDEWGKRIVCCVLIVSVAGGVVRLLSGDASLVRRDYSLVWC